MPPERKVEEFAAHRVTPVDSAVRNHLSADCEAVRCDRDGVPGYRQDELAERLDASFACAAVEVSSLQRKRGDVGRRTERHHHTPLRLLAGVPVEAERQAGREVEADTCTPEEEHEGEERNGREQQRGMLGLRASHGSIV